MEDQVADVVRARGVYASGGLVEDEEAGVSDERLREADALEHAFGVAAEAAVVCVCKANGFKEMMSLVFEGGAGEAAEFSKKEECFQAGEVFVEVGILGQETHVFAAPDKGRVDPKDRGGACRGRHKAKQDFHGGAFAGPVGAQEAINLAWRNFQRQVFDSAHGVPAEGHTKVLGEVLDGNGRSAHGIRSVC